MIYKRHDSPFWWIALERPGLPALRRSTGIPHEGGSPLQNTELKRQATEHYALKKAELIRTGEGLGKPTITFKAYADWYETHIVAHRRSAARDRSSLKVLRAHFGSTLLSALDGHQIREWMTARRDSGLQPSTVNRELDVLKSMLAMAIPKYLTSHPAAGIRRFRVSETEPRVLTTDEEARILRVASDEERALVILAVDTLLRLSNVVFLKWDQVKLKLGVIVPLNAKVSHDRVPVSARLRRALEALPKGTSWVLPSFHEKGVGKTAAKNRVIRAFHDLCQKANVRHGRKAEGVTFHSLRHTGATRAMQAGHSTRTVMKLGGWRDHRSVNRYTHPADEDVQRAAESIGAKVKSPIPFTSRARSQKRR